MLSLDTWNTYKTDKNQKTPQVFTPEESAGRKHYQLQPTNTLKVLPEFNFILFSFWACPSYMSWNCFSRVGKISLSCDTQKYKHFRVRTRSPSAFASASSSHGWSIIHFYSCFSRLQDVFAIAAPVSRCRVMTFVDWFCKFGFPLIIIHQSHYYLIWEQSSCANTFSTEHKWSGQRKYINARYIKTK